MQSLYQHSRLIASVRTSDIYEAVDLITKKRVLLWVLRWPIDPTSDEGCEFRHRLGKILHSKINTLDIQHYGIDLSGTAFLSANYSELSELIGPRYERKDICSIFCEIVKSVANLHQRNLVCGDLCAHSFQISPQGRIVSANLLGSIFPSGVKIDPSISER